MRIGIDGRSLVGARRGVARVTAALLSEMSTRYPQDEWRVLLPPGTGAAPAGTRARRTSVPGRVMFGSAALIGRPRLDALLSGVDVVWLPATAPVAISRSVPSVLTLHDLSWVQRPADFSAYERFWHLLARPRSQAVHAASVAAVSEYTRRVAVDRWSLDPERVVVVRPPIAPPTNRERPGSGDGRLEYFLWVGALEPRKGPDVLEEAWRRARSRGLAAGLVVVGDGRVPLDGPGVQRRRHVSDAELGALYAGALALVLPSRLEGAGLPPLEAALHGAASICSDLPPLRESLGDEGAEWVPPGDPVALAEALLLIARDRDRRRRIAEVAGTAAATRTDAAPAAAEMRALLAEAASR